MVSVAVSGVGLHGMVVGRKSRYKMFGKGVMMDYREWEF